MKKVRLPEQKLSGSEDHGLPGSGLPCKRALSGLLAAGWILVFVFSCTLRAEEFDRWSGLADTVFHHYTAEQGLPNPIATSLAEDENGFIWVGTQGGLGRWDGYRFRNYLPDTTVAGSLPDSYITTLHVDASGRLWVGTAGGGLAGYDRNQDRFVCYRAGPGGLSHAYVWGITDDGSGGLWIGTDGGLDHLDVKAGIVTSLHHDAHVPSSLADNRVQAVLRDGAGTLWVGTRTGLAHKDGHSNRFIPVQLGENNPNVSVVALVEDAQAEDGKKQLWIGTDQGAYVLEDGDVMPRLLNERYPGGPRLRGEEINTITSAGQGGIWLGTFHQGIVVLDRATHQFRRIRHDQGAPGSLMHDQIYAILRDREGSMWVANSRGLDRCNSGTAPVSTVFSALSRADKNEAADVDAIFPAPDGRVWVGFNGGGVDVLDLKSRHIQMLNPDPARQDSALPRAGVYAIKQFNGKVYIGTRRGLYRADQSGASVKQVRISRSDFRVGIRALLVDGATLWIASGGDGLWEATGGAGSDGRSGGNPQIRQRLTPEQLTDGRVVALQRGAGSDLWIGTLIGLNRLDLGTGAVEHIVPNPFDPEALSDGFVSSLVIDKVGRLWAGTLGGGVAVMTARDRSGKPRFRRFGVADGLPNANVDRLLLDSRGRVWASTDAGLAVIDPDTFTIHGLRSAEGVDVLDYWVNSGANDADGSLLFGGEGGLSVVHPDRFVDWHYRPPIVVTEIRVGEKQVPAGRFNQQGSGSESPAALELLPEANSLQVEFSALDYTAPERNRYAYRLDGYDRNWIESNQNRRVAAYTNLPAGNYTLELRGSNRIGEWSEETRLLKVHVIAAWYQTSWFWLALVLLGIGGVFGIVEIRTAYLRRRQRELERLVELRTSELEESRLALEKIAYVDVLTSLPNRRLFVDEFRKLAALTMRQRRRFALLLVDLDGFKQVNDSFGHDSGDVILIESVRRLQAVLRASDLIYRLGGDEFAILLPDTQTSAEVEAVFQRTVDSFADVVRLSEVELKVSASIGAALFPDHGATQELLYKAADIALYEAKRAGRNTGKIYSPESHADVDGHHDGL